MKILLLIIYVTGVAAAQFRFAFKRDQGPLACMQLVSNVLSPTLRYALLDTSQFCLLDDQPRLGSVAGCLLDGGFSDPDMYIDSFLKSCSSFNLTRSQLMESYKNATNYYVDPSYYQRTKRSDVVPGVAFPLPIKFTRDAVQYHFVRLYKDAQTMNWEMYFGFALVGYWFAVMFVAAIYNWSHFLLPLNKRKHKSHLANWFTRNISMAPLGSYYHATPLKWPFGGLLPTRFETIVVTGWLLLMFAFCFPQLNIFHRGNLAGTVAKRFSNISVFNVPLLVLFAGRNNIMQWVTGWGYSRFLTFHKWISRVTFLMVFLHAIAETVYMKKVHAYGTLGVDYHIVLGYVGFVAMSFMVFQSLYFLRCRHYEIFLFTHITLAAIFIAGGWIHCAGRGGVELFYASVAIWVLDRVVRLQRLCAFGIQEALVEIKADETLRVTVNRPSYWRPFPGSHAFIHFIRPSCFWQSHPFTLVDSVSRENTITFYVKIKGGISHGLYRQIMNEPKQSMKLRVTVEGPYSVRIPIHKYQTAVFLAGGNGIPGLYYEAHEMAKAKTKQQIKMYWVISHFRSLEWFFAELQKLMDSNVEVIVYVTRPCKDVQGHDAAESDSLTSSVIKTEKVKTTSSHSESILDLLPHVEFRYGRPNVRRIVEEEIADADNSIGFVTCAHPAMVDDVRAAIRDNLRGKTLKRVDLFEQIQCW